MQNTSPDSKLRFVPLSICVVMSYCFKWLCSFQQELLTRHVCSMCAYVYKWALNETFSKGNIKTLKVLELFLGPI